MSGNNVCPIKILYRCFTRDDSIYITDMCWCIWCSVVEQQLRKMCRVGKVVTFTHFPLPSGSSRLFIACAYCSLECRYCFAVSGSIPKCWQATLTKYVATVTHCIPQLCVKIAPWPFSCVCFSLGNSWCTCSATSLSLQRCRRCCAKGRTSWTTRRAGAEMMWWRGTVREDEDIMLLSDQNNTKKICCCFQIY